MIDEKEYKEFLEKNEKGRYAQGQKLKAIGKTK